MSPDQDTTALEQRLHRLYEDLRTRYRFALGPADFGALRQAMLAGFGLRTRVALRLVCCLLWAKTPAEQQILVARFDDLIPYEWDLTAALREAAAPRPSLDELDATQPVLDAARAPTTVELGDEACPEERPVERLAPDTSPPVPTAQRGLPLLPGRPEDFRAESFVFVPQFPLAQREIVQAWRRLRRPERFGPPIELDVDATVASRTRLGFSSLVFIPPLRNASRLLLLLDRGGWMSPYHRFCDYFAHALLQVTRLGSVAIFYFHNTPAQGADRTVLERFTHELAPRLDPILPVIEPLVDGMVFRDPALLEPVATEEVLRLHAERAGVVIISDAGAGRGRYDVHRLLDTVAFLKALRGVGARTVWLNPLPRRYWGNGYCAQLQRHVSMLELDRASLHMAVDVLRGKPIPVERAV